MEEMLDLRPCLPKRHAQTWEEEWRYGELRPSYRGVSVYDCVHLNFRQCLLSSVKLDT
jgi:hypothetical protein